MAEVQVKSILVILHKRRRYFKFLNNGNKLFSFAVFYEPLNGEIHSTVNISSSASYQSMPPDSRKHPQVQAP